MSRPERHTFSEVDPNKWQVTKLVVKVETISDDKSVRDLETQVANIKLHFSFIGFMEHTDDAHRARVTRLKTLDDVRHGETRVNDVFNNQYMLPSDGLAQIID